MSASSCGRSRRARFPPPGGCFAFRPRWSAIASSCSKTPRRAPADAHDAQHAADRGGPSVLRPLPRSGRGGRARRGERRGGERRLAAWRAARDGAARPRAPRRRADAGALSQRLQPHTEVRLRLSDHLLDLVQEGVDRRHPPRAHGGFELHLAQDRRGSARALRLARLSRQARRAARARRISPSTIACCCAFPARSNFAGRSIFTAKR